MKVKFNGFVESKKLNFKNNYGKSDFENQFFYFI